MTDLVSIPTLNTARLELRAPIGEDYPVYRDFFADAEASHFYGVLWTPTGHGACWPPTSVIGRYAAMAAGPLLKRPQDAWSEAAAFGGQKAIPGQNSLGGLSLPPAGTVMLSKPPAAQFPSAMTGLAGIWWKSI